MKGKSDLMIEKMSVQEIQKIFDDLNDKNQMLETHLNIMKKGFRVVTKFRLFLVDIQHKFDEFLTEEESKQLSNFQKELSDITQTSTNILMESIAKSSADSSLDIPLSKKLSKTGGNKTKDKSIVVRTLEGDPLHMCPHVSCRRVFANKTQLEKHQNYCTKPLKTITMSCESSDVESGQPSNARNRMAAKRSNNKKPKSTQKTYSKTENSSQTPFSSALMSLATESISLNKHPISGHNSLVCRYSRCGYKGSSLMDLMDHKLSSHLDTSSATISKDKNQKKSSSNEELIVSHTTDNSNDCFGEWIDSNSDSYFKCSESSCGALFPESSDLLRHMEAHNSSDVVFLNDDDELQMKSEPKEDNNDFQMKEFDGSEQMQAMDPFVEQVTNFDDHSTDSRNSSSNKRSFLLSSTSDSEKVSFISCTEDLCEITFEIIDDLVIHLKAVHNKRVKGCTFNDCHFLYENRSDLWTHMNECHKGQALPFKCDHRLLSGVTCSKAFFTKADLNRHITSFHAIDRYTSISGIFISDTLSNCQSVKRKKS